MGLFGKRNTDEGELAGSKSPSPIKGFFKGLMGSSGAKVKSGKTPPTSPADATRSRRQLLPEGPELLPAESPKTKVDAAVEITAQAQGPRPANIHGLSVAIGQLSAIRGDGLVGAALQSSALADSLTALVEQVAQLEQAAAVTYGHRQNVLALSTFFLEVVHMLDANGSRLDAAAAATVRRVASAAREASELVAACAQPGWLARTARGEGVREEFVRLHAAALEAMRAGGVDMEQARADGLPARRLGAGDYADLSKRMKKLLKQVGAGSVEGGVRRLRDDEAARREVAVAAGAPPEAVLRDALLDPDVTSGAAVVGDSTARDAECDKVFREYLTASPAHVTADGFFHLATDLGLLDGVEAYDRPAAARTMLVAADADLDGALCYDEFRAFYTRQPTTAARLQLRMATSLQVERQLHDTFTRFAAFGKHAGGSGAPGGGGAPALDCSRFSKACKDCGLLGGGLTSQYADIVFSKSKPRDARRMSFDHFVAALALVGERKGQALDRVAMAVVAAAGPGLSATTKTSYVKLHDDKSQFTGVYARGGPSHEPTNLDLKSLVDRGREPPRPPPPSGLLPPKLDVTKPESPVLSTQHRVAKHGPATPGRGAPMSATAARAAARASAAASAASTPPLSPAPPSALGRTSAARAPTKASPARAATAPGAPSPVKGVLPKRPAATRGPNKPKAPDGRASPALPPAATAAASATDSAVPAASDGTVECEARAPEAAKAPGTEGSAWSGGAASGEGVHSSPRVAGDADVEQGSSDGGHAASEAAHDDEEKAAAGGGGGCTAGAQSSVALSGCLPDVELVDGEPEVESGKQEASPAVGADVQPKVEQASSLPACTASEPAAALGEKAVQATIT